MDTMLRLGSRDRSSFLFKKPVQQSPDGTSALSGSHPFSEPLPSIAHLDTRSFVGLFDRYQSSDPSQDTIAQSISQANPSAKDFAWPVASPLHSSSVMLNSQTDRTTTQSTSATINATGSVLVARNDSTGSSSVALSRRSDDSPPMTRNSSSSSMMEPPSPLIQTKTQPQTEEFTALPDVEKDPASPFKLNRRASTWGSSASSQKPDLYKPLPPLQDSRPQPSIPFLQPFGYATGPTPSKYPSMRNHHRSTSVNFPLVSKSETPIAELATSSPRHSRGARLGRAIVDPRPRQRSKSATMIEGIDCFSGARKDKLAQRASGPPSIMPQVPKVPRQSKKQPSKPISSRTAEQVIYRIMCHLDNVKDLQSTALVSKGFLNTYQRNESKLVSHLIFKNSRPAWELRRSVLTLRGTKTFHLNAYVRDLRTIKALKAFILSHCGSVIKPKTAAGLAGQDRLCEMEVDNALWRIWTFCALFGENAAQNPIPPAEIDWLNGSNGINSRSLGAGFAVGNGQGLTADELEDTMEMWTCLQNLLSQFHGREDEAKRAGIFDNWQVGVGISREQHLKEWTSYLMTLGPQVVLSLSSGSFDRAKMFGLTQWKLPPVGQTRTMFLTSAISQVYQERILAEATAKAAQITLPRMSSTRHRPSKSADIDSTRQRSLRLDTSVVRRRPVSVSVSVPRTVPSAEIRPDCDPSTIPPVPPIPAIPRASTLFPASPTNDPTFFHTLSMTATVSTKLGATLFPIDYTNQSPRIPFPAAPSRAPPPPPDIVDPVDKHLHLLVHELGFNENRAKRALAMCDNGTEIDVQQAVELLMVESKHSSSATNTPVELPTPTAVLSPLRLRRQKRDICSGECKRTTSTSFSPSINTSLAQSRIGSMYSRRSSHRRSKSAGASAILSAITPTTSAALNEDIPISPITDIYGGHSSSEAEDDASEIRREELDMVSPLMTTPTIMSNLRRKGTKTKKAWKVLGVSEQDPVPQKKLGRTRSRSQGVVGMEEYERRVERRRSLRMIQQQQQQQQGQQVEAVTLKTGLQENLKGLGLGGLGGLRVLERDGIGKGKSKVRRESCLPVSPC